MSRRKPKQTKRSRKPLILFLIIVVAVGFFSYHSVKYSIEFIKRDRVNVLLYGKQTVVYSLGLHEAGNYVIPFYPDLKVDVPGGYGTYRIGALGKLVALEKKPDILAKTFSQATSAFITYYIYSNGQEVYFGAEDQRKVVFPSITQILLSQSNATLPEKIALLYIFLKTPPQKFTVINTVESEKGGERILLTENFYQQYQGYFYQKTYRQEKKDVQILYSKSYESAARIGQILEGNGIRVSDISEVAGLSDICIVKESAETFSNTARTISDFFGCQLKHDKTDIYDILVELGHRQSDW